MKPDITLTSLVESGIMASNAIHFCLNNYPFMVLQSKLNVPLILTGIFTALTKQKVALVKTICVNNP